MNNILLIGEDSQLLETRAAILAKIAHVSTCRSSSLPALQLGEEYQLVILCHTLDHRQRTDTVQEVRTRWSKARIVQLDSGLRPHPALAVDAVIPAEPRALLKNAREMLQSTHR